MVAMNRSSMPTVTARPYHPGTRQSVAGKSNPTKRKSLRLILTAGISFPAPEARGDARPKEENQQRLDPYLSPGAPEKLEGAQPGKHREAPQTPEKLLLLQRHHPSRPENSDDQEFREGEANEEAERGRSPLASPQAQKGR